MRFDNGHKMVVCDPGNNMQSTLIALIQALRAANIYVILDLHWDEPSQICPTNQDFMCSLEHGVNFWKSVANVFGYPNGTHADRGVVFELYNEPYHGQNNGTLYPVTATATGGSTTTIIDSSRSWATNMWVGSTVTNANTGLTATVTANTATTLTFGAMATANAAGHIYRVGFSGTSTNQSTQALMHGCEAQIALSQVEGGSGNYYQQVSVCQLSGPPVGGCVSLNCYG
jgi:Cellulase (glycosyl hydrolase family 5)